MDPGSIALDRSTGEVSATASLTPAIVAAAERREPGAAEALFCALYNELRQLAEHELARGRGGDANIGARSLLHEAYLVMRRRDGDTFSDRGHFMAYAACVIRGLIVDHARNRHAQKRGGRFHITSLDADVAEIASHNEYEGVGDALARLAELAPALAELVDLRFFCGFSFAEIAAMRGVSERTVQRRWEQARLYLQRTM
jgi:RNA polymerase sigma factor (TIGR02999 family)